MTELPVVTVLILTYNRPVEVVQTIEALRKRLRYKGELKWHLADDGSPSGYVASIREQFPDLKFSLTKTDREGCGANANKAMDFIKTPYIFFSEDDWYAFRDIPLDHAVELMEFDQKIGMVRFSGLIDHELILIVDKARTEYGKIHHLVLDKRSPETYQYSSRPHLKHKRFHEAYGNYAEGLSIADTERAMAKRYRTMTGPLIAAMPEGIGFYFYHIGKGVTWKRTGFDAGGS